MTPIVVTEPKAGTELRACSRCTRGWLAVEHEANRCARCRARAGRSAVEAGPTRPGGGPRHYTGFRTGEVRWPLREAAATVDSRRLG
jgi:hypothetical protein